MTSQPVSEPITDERLAELVSAATPRFSAGNDSNAFRMMSLRADKPNESTWTLALRDRDAEGILAALRELQRLRQQASEGAWVTKGRLGPMADRASWEVLDGLREMSGFTAVKGPLLRQLLDEIEFYRKANGENPPSRKEQM